MEPRFSNDQSKQTIDRSTESSRKNELITTLGGVVPIASFAIKLWVKIIKLSFKAAIWMVRKLPSPIRRVEHANTSNNPTIIRDQSPSRHQYKGLSGSPRH
jgi:hypothetical protein